MSAAKLINRSIAFGGFNPIHFNISVIKIVKLVTNGNFNIYFASLSVFIRPFMNNLYMERPKIYNNTTFIRISPMFRAS